MKPWLPFVFVLCVISLGAESKKPEAAQLIAWLLQDKQGFREIPFAEVVSATSGKKILPLDLQNEADRELIAKIGKAADAVLRRMNLPESAIRQQKRINEASSHFEDELKRVLNETPGFSCDFPRTTEGKLQRSGYPDLRLADKKSGRVIYLDPKLYEQNSRSSTLRTFYFEPKTDTNKILEDAHHLLLGFAHDGKVGEWTFLNWELVDLSRFQVRLKAEFQGSNRDLYREEAVVGTSRK